ncbi:platelet-activating factor acetylhydrolase IB subunit alpha2 [Nilaparvata lugens]|uniref:platelet-activating factor acetylhydrolase IB subunit alpha2 n=1 Tax=Nilaparvata lugens TaxID=108931 RepID=UPI00193E9491|nr:platelet-activating factor acetylhydrolase IB subunit alpha2 [Nilaparvata lugens]
MNPCVVACVPVDPHGDDRWMSQHKRHVLETREREPEVLLIGDSIIHHLQYRPIWNELFEPLHCLNFGISGDSTQHVLWRIQNGALENIKPKVIVLLVGTNNVSNTAEEVSEGIIEIVRTIRGLQPDCQIVVIDLLPRGQLPNELREKNAAVNKLVRSKLAGWPKVEIVASDKGLIQQDGTISHLDMLDYLHLTEGGYRKAFESLHELLLQLLSEGEEEKDLTPSE